MRGAAAVVAAAKKRVNALTEIERDFSVDNKEAFSRRLNTITKQIFSRQFLHAVLRYFSLCSESCANLPSFHLLDYTN